MCRQVLRIFFAFLAIVLGTVGLLLFTVRLQLFNADFYKQALNDAEIYSLVADAVDRQVTAAINGEFVQEESEEEQNQFGPELLGNIVSEILNQLDLELILKTTAENNLDNIEEWAAGKTEEPLIYFPKDELINGVDNDSITDTFFNTFFKEAEAQFDTLPECTSEEAAKKAAESIDLANLDASNLECISPEIKQQIRNEIEVTVPLGEDFNFMEEIIGTNFGNLEQETPISQFQPDLSEEERANITEQAKEIQKYIELSNLILLLVIAVSLLFAFIAALLGTENKYSIFYKIYLIVGLILTFISSILSYLAGPNLIDKIPLSTDNFPDILADEGSMIIEKVDIIAESVISGLFQVTLMFGIIITILSIVFWIISTRLSKNNTNSKSESKKK